MLESFWNTDRSSGSAPGFRRARLPFICPSVWPWRDDAVFALWEPGPGLWRWKGFTSLCSSEDGHLSQQVKDPPAVFFHSCRTSVKIPSFHCLNSFNSLPCLNSLFECQVALWINGGVTVPSANWAICTRRGGIIPDLLWNQPMSVSES